MKNGPGTPLTLEKRLERAAKSQAASPEAAARLVQRLAQTHTVSVFSNQDDLARASGLLEEYMDRLEEDLMHYGGFCRSFWMAVEDDAPRLAQGGASALYRPVLGTRVNNAVVLLGLMLLDHARGRRRDRDVYHCTRMTLGQYLGALPTLAYPGDGPADQRFRTWRDLFLRNADPSAPLADALADILRSYIAGWRVLGRLDHILDCMDGLAGYLEEERTAELDRGFREAMRQCIAETGVENVEVVVEDERERLPDPYGHFLGLARAYSGDVPDPGAEDTAAGAVREQVFLSRWDYSPQTLATLAEEAPSPAFRALLEEHIDPKGLRVALAKVNRAVTDLFMLWVDPYLRMEKAAGPSPDGDIRPQEL